MSPVLLAVAVAAAGLVATAAWFGIRRRRREEAELGVQALATMKWRDSIALVLEALQREGYDRIPDSVEEAGATEFLLLRGGQRTLLGYKHGTAYRISEANLREFAGNAQMRGARRGVLVTLGLVEPAARMAADGAGVQLIDGPELWSRLRALVPPELLADVQRDAAGRTSQGLWAGVAGSLVLALAVFAGARYLAAPEAGGTAPASALVPVPTTAPAAAPQTAAIEPGAPADAGAGASGTAASATQAGSEAMLAQLRQTARAMEEVSRLTPEELGRRRADVARQVALLSQVDTANWSAQRTLLIRMERTDGKDKSLVEEVCRIVTQHEEMRYTRIQLEPPSDSKLAVRWRLCE